MIPLYPITSKIKQEDLLRLDYGLAQRQIYILFMKFPKPLYLSSRKKNQHVDFYELYVF
ncbi:hypothetical protein M472_14725 [Sphingobacterium paucimobilis HER1398]|uniref:Uncharacterized protein n=1 Tax=Sphingobacterium paucimobilis HER1398 TaxID=1346330 RepID=U2HE29_9SPHI|nr:hypothetical protein M472_14725 [Sphingobacterium paucimobilis HER1398]